MRSILFVPFRLAVGWGISPRVLGFIGVTMLVLLRVTIGWHFHSEGVAKYQQGDWDAAPFFANAKGPFAEHYHELVWDHQGKIRRDPEYTRWWLEQYRDRAAEYFTFADAEREAADSALNQLMDNLDIILTDNADDLAEYELGLEHIADLKSKQDRTGVESLAGQIETVQRENNNKLKPVLAEIDQLWDAFESQINSLAAPNQREASPEFRLKKPRSAMVDTSVMNEFVPYFDMAIGWCLLLGLFTPVASLMAAGFLGSVFLSQFPPEPGPLGTINQLVECMACLVLAGTGAGRFAGLDFFLHLLVRKNEASQPAAK